MIEDDPDLRRLLTTLLSEDAAHLIGAFEPETLDRGAGPFDLAFTDLRLPHVDDEADARSWICEVRKVARRVVLVTGQPSAVRLGASALGADALIPKPFDLDMILAAIGGEPA